MIYIFMHGFEVAINSYSCMMLVQSYETLPSILAIFVSDLTRQSMSQIVLTFATYALQMKIMMED